MLEIQQHLTFAPDFCEWNSNFTTSGKYDPVWF